jgi:hypothetical protein
MDPDDEAPCYTAIDSSWALNGGNGRGAPTAGEEVRFENGGRRRKSEKR